MFALSLFYQAIFNLWPLRTQPAEAALCCQEIVLLVAVGFRLTLIALPIKSSLQTPTNHCIITHCGILRWCYVNISCCLLLLGLSETVKTDVSSLLAVYYTSVQKSDQHCPTIQRGENKRRGLKSYICMLQKAYVDSQHQRIVFHVLSALVKLSSNLPENQRNLSHTFCGINSLFVSFNNTCTFHLERKKKTVCFFGGSPKTYH